MTRHVYPNDMVAHLWANQSQHEAHSGNLSFEGRAIKSYWLTIGSIVQDKDGVDVALILNDYDTMTTKHHIGIVHRAVHSGMPSYRVDYLDGSPASHRRNVAAMLAHYAELAGKARRGQRASLDWRLDAMARTLRQAREYAARFAVEPEAWPDDAATVAAIVAVHDARDAKANDPKTLAKRERAAATAHEREIRHYRNATGKYQPQWYPSYRVLEALGITAADKEARDSAIQARYADAITLWRQGERVSVPRGNSAMLRLRHTGTTNMGEEGLVAGNWQDLIVETSWGASFPASHGAKAFPLLKRLHDAGQAWERNGHTIHLGHFQVDRVDADGTVHAGCHVVAWTEIEGIARLLGLIPAE